MSREIIEAVKSLERDKGIDGETLLSALEDALLAAYRKTPDAVSFAKVEIDREMGVFRIHQFVGDELPDEAIIVLDIDEEALAASAEAGEEDDEDFFDVDWSKVPVDEIEVVEVSPQHSFGRIAAQTARQVILQRIRDFERGVMYEEYVDRVGDIVNGVVQSTERGVTIVELKPGSEAILPFSEGIPGERFDYGSRVKAVILDVRTTPRGPQIVLSRASELLIKQLFELEVPEIADGLVEIKSVAREAGFRTKIAVVSNVQGVDPVGACVGPRGSRVRMVVSELRGEKIDIIPYNEEPARFIAKALSPARVREVIVDDEDRQATVIVPDDQLALAIGREGQNARMAAKLTGWKIDIRGASDYAEEELGGSGGDETNTDSDGRCIATMKTGKRCPNMAVDGSQYCALPHHQALANGEQPAEDDGEPEAEQEPESEDVQELTPEPVAVAENDSDAGGSNQGEEDA